MAIREVGTPADDTALALRLAHMPAGDYLGDKWRSEPMRFATVWVDDESNNLLEEVSMAYPFHPRGDFCEFIAVVPVTVARLLEYLSDEGAYVVETYDPPFFTNDHAMVAALLAGVTGSDLLDDEAYVEWLDEVADAATERDLPVDQTVRFAAELARELPFDDALQGALLALVRPEPV